MSALSKHGFTRTRSYTGRCSGCGKNLTDKASYDRTFKAAGEMHLCYKCFLRYTQEVANGVRCM